MVFVIYAANKPLTRDHRRVFVSGDTLDFIYLRVEKMKPGVDLDEALSEAKPLQGETVLNSFDDRDLATKEPHHAD